MRNSNYVDLFLQELDRAMPAKMFTSRPQLGLTLNTQEKLMATDILEYTDSYEYKINTPGFSKQDISLNIEEGVLVVDLRHQEVFDNSSAQLEDKSSTDVEARDNTVDKAGATNSAQSVEKLDKTAIQTTAAQPKTLYRERQFMNIQRTYQLPKNANPESVEASYDNGVLSIKIEKVVKKTTNSQIAIK